MVPASKSIAEPKPAITSSTASTFKPSGGSSSFLDAILKGELKAQEETLEKIEANQANLEKLWKAYLEDPNMKVDPFFYSYAVSATPQWKAPNIIYVKLKSNIAQGAFSNNKSNFIPYLQKRLLADQLVFESEVELDESILAQPKESGTVIDRLKDLQQSNPAVDALIERFKLDFYKHD